MLEWFDLTEKILGLNADNATANDTQTTKLDSFDNSFKEEYRVWCFNHTLQLSAKTLLRPFNTALSREAADDVDITDEDDDDPPILEADKEGEEEEDENENENEEDKDKDEEDDGIDELETLNKEERTQVLEDTAAVRATVTKVRDHEAENVRLLNYWHISRYDDSLLRSFIQRQSLCLPGVGSASNSASKRSLSHAMW
jgi:hypothetical protein